MDGPVTPTHPKFPRLICLNAIGSAHLTEYLEDLSSPLPNKLVRLSVLTLPRRLGERENVARLFATAQQEQLDPIFISGLISLVPNVDILASIKLRTAKMSLSSYILMLIVSLFSQGILLSASKSIRNLEDDVVFNTFRMGKAFQKEDAAERSVVAPSLEQYKNDDSGFLSDDENKNSKNPGSKQNLLSHGLPLNLAIKPYLALKGSVAFPAENGVQNSESTQEKREIGDEENSAKFPIGRRDFDSE
ncbi:pro-MCH [Alexandromys fortis]|uniref:pro-MCH n=1 Tax=Alexandromys fortis TaxID=100897 RepID=UPI0021529880|nr:pro-MCH [Microtus fortis]